MKAMILVLVSDIQAADLIAFELSREGYYLIRACNGQDGLRLLRTRKPDVVLIDLPAVRLPRDRGRHLSFHRSGLLSPFSCLRAELIITRKSKKGQTDFIF